VKRRHRPTAAQFSFDDSEGDFQSRKKLSVWPLLVVIVLLVSLLIAGYWMYTHPYVDNQSKFMFHHGEFR
jgi:hypothetical protein